MSEKKSFHFTLRSIFYNDKILIVFSLLIATAIWIMTAMNISPPDEKTISDIPVEINLDGSVPSQFGLKLFNNEEKKISVTVSGKRYAIRDISVDDIKASVDTSSVTSSGKHTLPITVSPAGKQSDFSIVDYTPSYVEAYFDTYSEFSANVETELNGEYSIAEGFIMGDVVLSTDVVTVSGPTTEVNKVVKVVARAELSGVLSDTVTETPELLALDSAGNAVNNITLQYDKSNISVTVPILKKANLPVDVTLVNAPGSLTMDNLKVTYSPSNLDIAATSSVLSTLTKITVGQIDFSKVSPGKNTFEFDLTKLTSVTLTDNAVTTVTVTIDLSAYKTKNYTVPQENIQVVNAPAGYTARINSSAISGVKVMGPLASLDKLSEADIFAIVDLTDVSAKTSTSNYKVRFTVKNYGDCWVIGSYEVSLSLIKETA